LILGASTRAAAHSARRAGLKPIGIDLFADVDLAIAGEAYRVPRDKYPRALLAWAERVPEAPWLYTGALENHPELIQRIAQVCRLWGNGADAVRAARDPVALAGLLKSAGLATPRVEACSSGLPTDGSWLIKPRRSAGGGRIEAWRGQAMHLPEQPCYFQERVEGPSFGAVFLGHREGARLAGLTRQLIGRPGAEFAYRGSVGPWPVADLERAQVETLGDLVARQFGLVGIFGVDLILKEGRPYPVEINPRYTASVELLELALGRALLEEHRRVCDPKAEHEDARQRLRSQQNDPPRIIAKEVLFAPRALRFPDKDDLLFDAMKRIKAEDWFAIPRVADIPQPGSMFKPGEPVLTVFASAQDHVTCLGRLEREYSMWEKWLLTEGAAQ
jgi:predicted ATP-grasp superfamily ATP-dependent carboligase